MARSSRANRSSDIDVTPEHASEPLTASREERLDRARRPPERVRHVPYREPVDVVEDEGCPLTGRQLAKRGDDVGADVMGRPILFRPSGLDLSDHQPQVTPLFALQ